MDLGTRSDHWKSANSLPKRDIRLIIYMTARAPMRHYKVIKAMGDTLPSINGKPAGPGVDHHVSPPQGKGFQAQ